MNFEMGIIPPQSIPQLLSSFLYLFQRFRHDLLFIARFTVKPAGLGCFKNEQEEAYERIDRHPLEGGIRLVTT